MTTQIADSTILGFTFSRNGETNFVRVASHIHAKISDTGTIGTHFTSFTFDVSTRLCACNIANTAKFIGTASLTARSGTFIFLTLTRQANFTLSAQGFVGVAVGEMTLFVDANAGC